MDRTPENRRRRKQTHSRRAPRVVVIGPARHPDLAGLMPAIAASAAGGIVAEVECAGMLLPAKTAEEMPDLIVLAQARRGEHSPHDVEALRQWFPLAAMVVVYGPWCEGETRSGQPLAGIPRVVIGNWPIAWNRFADEFSREGCSTWHLPTVISAVDRLTDPRLEASFASHDGPGQRITVRVAGGSQALVNLLIDAAGAAPVRFLLEDSATTSADLLMVDCRFSIAEAVRAAKLFKKPIPVLALLGFPRDSDRQQLREIQSQSRVLGKPYSNADVLAALEQMTAAKARSQSVLRLASGT